MCPTLEQHVGSPSDSLIAPQLNQRCVLYMLCDVEHQCLATRVSALYISSLSLCRKKAVNLAHAMDLLLSQETPSFKHQWGKSVAHFCPCGMPDLGCSQVA